MLQNSNEIELTRANLIIVVFVYLSIFINSYVFFNQPFEFYLGYLIYIVLLPVFIFRYRNIQSLNLVFSILLISGLFSIIIGNNTFAFFIKVYAGLLMAYYFYYYVIMEFNYNIEQLFKWYLKGAYIAALLGVFQFISFQIGYYGGYTFWGILNKWAQPSGGGAFGIRINSIFSEPTHLAAVLSAAFFVSVYNITRRETFGLSRFQSWVIILIYILSFSGLGQSGIFITLILLTLSYGFVKYIAFIIPVLIVLFNFLYNNVVEFKERYDSLTGLFSGTQEFKLGKTHGSSYILYNNYNVAIENFKNNFVFGGGIGSHPLAFEKYSLAKNITKYGFNLNSADANSMLLRLISETGLFGVLLILFIVVKYYVRRNSDYDTYHWLVSNAILVMILLNLFRQGHYFLNGFPFFVILYYFNSLSYKEYIEELQPSDELVENNSKVLDEPKSIEN